MITQNGTNWYHTPDRDNHNGPVWGFWRDIPSPGDGGESGFEVRVGIEIDGKTQFDQAAIFLYLAPFVWIKAGVEYDRDLSWDGAVVTNPFSDWSIQPHSTGTTSTSQFTISFEPPHVRIYLNDVLIREVNAFGAISGHEPTVVGSEVETETQTRRGKVFIGAMACSPKGGDVEATFERFEMREGVRPQ